MIETEKGEIGIKSEPKLAIKYWQSEKKREAGAGDWGRTRRDKVSRRWKGERFKVMN